ncbi:hypothetical protein [Marinobacterium weihaiense]|uniref:Uncharacterized protein n=1 Tax=Marinobacterium weihaiense TaxID=2851016 RepID=A0ABS6MAM0_9GAMM|nr:hypothetical protein [Marinobacterium weihaiense]MBV0933342.1 hypothetical protein [Marinobacterium weihaiense]
MLSLTPEPLTADNLIDQLEMLGGMAVMQRQVLQYSRLEHHFAFCRLSPAALQQRLDEAGEVSGEMRTLMVDAGVAADEARHWHVLATARGLEYRAVSDAEAAFEAHLAAVLGGRYQRVLIALRLSDTRDLVFSDYLV